MQHDLGPPASVRWTAQRRPVILPATAATYLSVLPRLRAPELRDLWGEVGNRPECRHTPLVDVQEFRSSGFAFITEGVYAAPHHPGCARGGNWQFGVRRDGRWISPRRLGGQDVPACRLLRRCDIPRMSGAKKCYDGTEVVPYR